MLAIQSHSIPYNKIYSQEMYRSIKDTVSKDVTRRKFAFHDFALSFLKNQSAHLFCNGCLTYEAMASGAAAPSVDCTSLGFS